MSTYSIFNKSINNLDSRKIFNFKDIEIFIKNYTDDNENRLNYIYSDTSVLEKNGIDRVFIYITNGIMTILDENNNIHKELGPNNFFELSFSNPLQKLSFYSSNDLELFIINNNPNKNNSQNTINNSRFKSNTLNNNSLLSETLTHDNFTQNILTDFIKFIDCDDNMTCLKLDTEEYYNLCDYRKFKLIKAVYLEDDKANLFIKDIIPKNDNPVHNNLTYILSGELELVSKSTGETVEILSAGDSFTSNAFKLSDDYYFVSRENLKLLVFATKAAYLELYEAINKFHKASLQCQEKDMYTHLHNQRVGALSMLIAKKMGLSKKSLETLRVASLFHDIGKVFTPNEILLKPGKLNDEEYEIMKEHVLHSYEMTKDFIDKDVCEIVIQHHERLNGRGYPYGLSEHEISIEAKILAIADTYDAMTSDRPYRKALSADIAIKELINYVDIHYDRELVKAFHDILFETKEITVRYI